MSGFSWAGAIRPEGVIKRPFDDIWITRKTGLVTPIPPTSTVGSLRNTHTGGAPWTQTPTSADASARYGHGVASHSALPQTSPDSHTATSAKSLVAQRRSPVGGRWRRWHRRFESPR